MLKLSSRVRILDLDGSVTTAQPKLMETLGMGAQVVDLRALGPSLRYLCGYPAVRQLERVLKGSDRNQLTFIGSGDFHHVTASLLRQFTEPLSLVVFDTHSDWDRRPPFPCCGSWIAQALEMTNIRRIVTIGLRDTDIGGWRINLGHPDALRSGRVIFFPYDCRASRTPRGAHSYRMIKGANWEAITGEILSELPSGSVYVSIDKDCLVSADAFTNWEVGGMRLKQIVSFLGRIARTHDVVGADITGEFSPLRIANPLFRAIASLDHPVKPNPSRECLQSNERTNLALASALTNCV